MALRGHSAAADPVESTIRVLIAACGPYRLALPADWIRGILTPNEAGSGTDIAWAGATYTRTDLAERLRFPPSTESSSTRVILYGNSTRLRAFTVDEVVELLDIDRGQLRPLPAHFKGAERTRLSGLLLYRDTLVLIVNSLWLLDIGSGMEASRPAMSIGQDGAERPSSDAVMVIPNGNVSVGP